MARPASFDEGTGRSFEEEWPELARRLDRFLAAKGVEVWLRADVVQETAARLYREWTRLDRSRPLWNLTVTIALRVLVDEHRKSARLELVSDLPESDVDDVEARALHRVQLTKTHSALQRLRAEHRRVLLAEIGEATTLTGSRNRINVLRLRARQALKGELGPWTPAAVVMRMRSLRAGIERRMAALRLDAHGVTASITTVGVAVTLLVAGGGHDAGNATPGIDRDDPELLNSLTINETGLFRGIRKISHTRLSETRSRATTGARQEFRRVREETPGLLGPLSDEYSDANDLYNDTRRDGHETVRKEANWWREQGNSAREEGNEAARKEGDWAREQSNKEVSGAQEEGNAAREEGNESAREEGDWTREQVNGSEEEGNGKGDDEAGD